MAFGIIRARNLSASDIASTDEHNARLYSSIEQYPENINPDGRFDVKYQSEISEEYLYPGETNLQKIIDTRLKENNVKGIRKNSNLAIEYVCTISDKKAWDSYHFSGFSSNVHKFLEERHGKDSVVAVYDHYDETNPHVHFVVVPLREKKIKWKNQQSQGERKETRLNTREFTGGRDKLRKLQDDYFKHLSDTYGVGKDNKFKVPLYRGTLAEHQHKEYTLKTNHEIALLSQQIEKAKDLLHKLKLTEEKLKKEAEMLKKEKSFKTEQAKTNEKTKKNWKSKGTQQNKTIFHTNSEYYNKKKKKGRSM